ncbi:hypothetical protein VTN00DRAFT_5846 [Thermoascus crustaceus]|uniref:uncharacterized protein n=1 Tax=Thermoascus crustaceus TaxID=5088 RepID=UPI00374237D7
MAKWIFLAATLLAVAHLAACAPVAAKEGSRHNPFNGISVIWEVLEETTSHDGMNYMARQSAIKFSASSFT